jgi:cell wall-associated NlpC family hydrolase
LSERGDAIVAEARTWLGTRYYHAGRDRNGIDCVGLLVRIAQELGFCAYDDVNYSPEEFEKLAPYLRRLGQPVPVPDPFPTGLEAGDLCQFMVNGAPRHAGIYARDGTGAPTLIHAYRTAGLVLEHPFDRHWARRLWAVYRPGEET